MTKVKYIKINAPLYVMLPRKTMKDKRIAINMNVYRNLNHFTNNSAKKQFGEDISWQLLPGVEIETPVEITYKVFKPTKRRLDKMNVISVMSKYLLDALSELGVWEDDNDEFVKTETLLPTEQDKEFPRCEIIIKTIEDDKV